MENKYLTYGLAILAVVLLVTSIFGFTTRVSKEDSALAVKTAQEAEQKAAQEKLDAVQKVLNDKVAQLTDSITKLQAQVDAKTLEIADLKATAATSTDLASKVEQLEAEKAALIDKLKKAQNDISALKELGKVFELNFEDSINDELLTDRNLNKLLDTSVEFDGEDYDVEESLYLDGLKLEISGVSGQEDFGAKPYLTSNGRLVYTYTFTEDGVKPTEDESVEITFLGKPMKITKVSTSNIEIQTGTNQYLFTGELISVEGKDLKLVGVSDTKTTFSYNGEYQSISIGSSKKFGTVTVKVVDAANYDNGNGFANIVVGTDAVLKLENGADYIEDNENYVFEYELYASGALKSLSVIYDVKSTDLEDDIAPITVGGKIAFPNDYIVIEFAELTDAKYSNVDVSFGNLHKKSNADHDVYVDFDDVLVIKAADKAIELNGVETSTVYATEDGIYFINKDNYAEKAITAVEIVNDDYTLTVSYDNVNKLTLNSLVYNANFEDEEFTGLYASVENDVLIADGTIIYDVENNADNGKVKLSIPSGEIKANILVK